MFAVRRLHTFLMGLLIFYLFLSPLQAQPHSAKQAVQDFISQIRSIDFSTGDEKIHEQAIVANAYLDLASLSQKALSGHWLNASTEEKSAFLEAMWKLIEYVAYPKSQEFMGDFEITYPESTENGTHAEVHSVILQPERGLDANVIYRLHSDEGYWKIDDVIVDDVSITEDLKYQFDKLIAQSQFQGLLQTMKDRLKQAKEEIGGAAK